MNHVIALESFDVLEKIYRYLPNPATCKVKQIQRVVCTVKMVDFAMLSGQELPTTKDTYPVLIFERTINDEAKWVWKLLTPITFY